MIRTSIIGVIAAILLAVGFWAGSTWQARQHDAADIGALNTRLQATQTALDATQKDWQRALADFRTDSAALNATAQEYADGRAKQDVFNRSLDARLDAALAARPELATCDIGADGLRIWNDANRGAAAAGGKPAAAAGDQPEPAAGVRGPAVGPVGQPAGPGKEPPAGDGAVPRLRGATPADDQGGATAAGRGSAARGSGASARTGRIELTDASGGEP